MYAWYSVIEFHVVAPWSAEVAKGHGAARRSSTRRQWWWWWCCSDIITFFCVHEGYWTLKNSYTVRKSKRALTLQRIMPVSRLISVICLQYHTGITYTGNKCVQVRNQRKHYTEIKSKHVKFKSCTIHAIMTRQYRKICSCTVAAFKLCDSMYDGSSRAHWWLQFSVEKWAKGKSRALV